MITMVLLPLFSYYCNWNFHFFNFCSFHYISNQKSLTREKSRNYIIKFRKNQEKVDFSSRNFCSAFFTGTLLLEQFFCKFEFLTSKITSTLIFSRCSVQLYFCHSSVRCKLYFQTFEKKMGKKMLSIFEQRKATLRELFLRELIFAVSQFSDFLRELNFADFSLDRKVEPFCELFDLCFSHMKNFAGT